jgi:integrase
VPRQTHEAREEEDASAKAFTEKQVSLIREELERLISEAEGAEKVKCTQVQCYFELMLEAGTRTDELYHWEFRDVKIKPSGEVLVDVRVSKTGRRNTIFMSETVTKLRNLYKSKNIDVKPSTSLWIDVGTQKRWSKQFFSGRFRKVLTAVELGMDYRMYCCRSTNITRALKRGVGTYLLSKNLGTSEMMISKYYEDIQIEHEGGALLGLITKKPDLIISEPVKEVFVPLV